MEQSELDEVLELHKEWLSLSKEGKRKEEEKRMCFYSTDLSGLDFRGYHLDKATIIRCNLSQAKFNRNTLQGTDLYQSNLSETDLSYVNFEEANLSESDISGANLARIRLYKTQLKGIKGMINVESQYPYLSYGYMYKGELRVRLGCFDRTVKEWNSDFWNNSEFPENSPEGQNRLMIYKFMREWLYANFPGLE